MRAAPPAPAPAGPGVLSRERDAALARVRALEAELERMQRERSIEAVARYKAERDANDLRDELRRLRAAGGARGVRGGGSPVDLLSGDMLGASEPRIRPATTAGNALASRAGGRPSAEPLGLGLTRSVGARRGGPLLPGSDADRASVDAPATITAW